MCAVLKTFEINKRCQKLHNDNHRHAWTYMHFISYVDNF